MIACALAGCAQILGLDELGGDPDGGAAGPPDAAPGQNDAAAPRPDASALECADSEQCSGATPICDRSACRACESNDECLDRDQATPLCATDGRCGACLADDDCTDPARPICDPEALTCRGCVAHADCASAVCDIAAGICVDPAEIVYVAPDGANTADCGTMDAPCRTPAHGIDQLTFERSYLRVTGTYQERITIAAMEARIIGAGATLDLRPIDSGTEAAVTINTGARVLIDGLRVANLSVGSGIACNQAELTLRNATVDHHNGTGVSAIDCPLIIDRSRITDNGGLGVSADSQSGGNLVIERSLIADNYGGGIGSGISPILIRNNLILRNSNLSEYHGAIRLRSDGPNAYITYNTIVGNMVNDAYIGIIQCDGAVLSSNIIWGNVWPGNVDQTIMDCEGVRNNVSDSALDDIPGNYMGDPMFVSVDENDYRLLPGSPAVDQGEAGLANLLDYDGNPRPQGAAPDVGALEAPAP